ncbi:hypothetical protein TraAM80_02760 [Trypanosoma rangeli]|uniref:Uncharacterized protein n=1 Tax=Trypanosoma rangeli TaxID=5698 RepID=A0A422NST6_TRYRA|nr:uncharacterized protein TraAM80_02760 [Trypanosoma rangeli]RNF08523.1 hypothetical protein TraAM80_02760 [Trypanosoma rangeli]|eukprot:RNF08523.1 hypothetical protein TraAM80_02760 [Trypanosoma rangeli]
MVARLHERLLVAPMTPSTAAEVLCTEHPCADTGVTAHLVNCLEGNGILLPLPAVLALVRCGYRHVPGSDHHAALRSQWAPMEETLFTALWIRLRRLRTEEGTAWGHVLPFHSGVKATTGHEGCGLHSSNALLQTLSLLVDVATFVHHSSLSSKARRLHLLADAVLPAMRQIEGVWHHLNEPNAPVAVPPGQLQEIRQLAGKCLRLYGKYILSFHLVLSEMLFAGISALSQTLQDSTRDAACVTAPTVFNALSEMREVLVGSLSRTECERPYLAGSMERWMEFVVQLAEVFTSEVTLQLKRVHADGTAANFHELRALHVEALNTFSILLVTYHRRVAVESMPAACGGILEKGLGVLRQLLRLLILRHSNTTTPSFSLQLSSTRSSDTGDYALTVRAWCACCEAAQVLYAFSVSCENCSGANEHDDAEVRSALLRHALHRLIFLRASGVGDHTVPPITFYLTLVRALRSWRGAPSATECVSTSALWDAARATLPGSLAASPPPVRLVVLFLEELCDSMALNVPVTPKLASPRIRKEAAVVQAARRAMWGNCLSHVNDRLNLGNTANLDDDVAFARGMLHIGAAANSVQAGAVVGLFENHLFLLGRLRDILLPVERGMRLCLDAVKDLQGEVRSNRKVEEEDEDDENDYRAILSGGAYWFVCEACLSGRLWHKAEDVIAGSSRGSCHCVLRYRGTADIVTAYVEFFVPVLVHGRKTTCGSNPLEEPFVALRSLYMYKTVFSSAAAVAAVDHGELNTSLQDTNDTAPSFTSAVSFLIECHQQLLLLPPGSVLPSHACRILRAMFAVSPHLFVCVPELSQFLLHRLFERPTRTVAAAAATVMKDTVIWKEAVREGAYSLIELADPRELWEMLLWTCAAKIARLSVCFPSGVHGCGAENGSALLSRAASDVRLDEDAEETLRLLYGMNDDSDDIFFTARRQVLRRALQLLRG